MKKLVGIALVGLLVGSVGCGPAPAKGGTAPAPAAGTAPAAAPAAADPAAPAAAPAP